MTQHPEAEALRDEIVELIRSRMRVLTEHGHDTNAALSTCLTGLAHGAAMTLILTHGRHAPTASELLARQVTELIATFTPKAAP